jgi:hypothetical protein
MNINNLRKFNLEPGYGYPEWGVYGVPQSVGKCQSAHNASAGFNIAVQRFWKESVMCVASWFVKTAISLNRCCPS